MQGVEGPEGYGGGRPDNAVDIRPEADTSVATEEGRKRLFRQRGHPNNMVDVGGNLCTAHYF